MNYNDYNKYKYDKYLWRTRFKYPVVIFIILLIIILILQLFGIELPEPN